MNKFFSDFLSTCKRLHVLDERFIEIFNWQQDIIQNSLMWNYLRKKSTK